MKDAGPGSLDDPIGGRLPDGFRIRLDRATRRLGPDLLAGGSPRRYLRLAAGGVTALAELERAGVGGPRTSALARRLTDAGLAHPVVSSAAANADVTVVIPVRDRAQALDEALHALGGSYPVVVVDDASDDGAAVEDVCARHRAALVCRPTVGGPGPARNTGWRWVETDLIVFLDSDVRAGPHFVEALAGHFADPTVAAVAPRVTGEAASRAVAGRYATARSPIDLGDRAALVAPTTRVAYVPAAALLVRRSALAEIGGFDPALRYGEDVDLVWRLIAAGWRVRYDPGVVVRHREPERWSAQWRRRFRYGTSAAPLASRHPDDIYPLLVRPLPAAGVVSLLAGWPSASAVAFLVTVLLLRRRLESLAVPASEPWTLGASAFWQTWLAFGCCGAQFALPVLLAAATRGPARRRLTAAALLLAPPLSDWARRRARLDPFRYAAAWLADEASYGLGVCDGCLRTGHWQALRPRFVASGARSLSSTLRRFTPAGRRPGPGETQQA
jgi:mycofactocin glycosyltransferase